MNECEKNFVLFKGFTSLSCVSNFGFDIHMIQNGQNDELDV